MSKEPTEREWLEGLHPNDPRNNNQCPTCKGSGTIKASKLATSSPTWTGYKEGRCSTCHGTGTQPQSKEQTKATIGDSTQNQESTKDPMPNVNPRETTFTATSSEPKEAKIKAIVHDIREAAEEAKKKHPQSSEGGGNLPTTNNTTVEETKPSLPTPYSRNGHSIASCYNHGEFTCPHCEATAVSHDSIKCDTCGEPFYKRGANGTIVTFHDHPQPPSKSTDKEYNYYLGIDYALQHDPDFRREYIRKHEAPTSSDGQGVQESSDALDEITPILIEYGEACYDHSGNTTHRRVAKERIQSLISSEKVKELKALLAADVDSGLTWGGMCSDERCLEMSAIEQRIKELEGD